MDLPQSAIEELKSIYEKEFGIRMNDDKAKASRLLHFFHKLLLFIQEHEPEKVGAHEEQMQETSIEQQKLF